MKYVKSCLIITMLLGIGYSQDCDPEADTGWNCDCNEDTWEEYYNSEGHNMEGCWLKNASLAGADLSFTNLYEANLEGAILQGAFFVNANLEGTIFDGADLTYAYFDENDDEYDDVSYDAGAVSGDLNLDGGDNVLDVVTLIQIILNP